LKFKSVRKIKKNGWFAW